MKTIYENASSVLVWLGPASNDSDRIMDFAMENGPGYVEAGGYFTANTTFTEGPEVVKTYLEASPNMGNLLKGPQMAKVVDSLSSLLYRDYWHRVWVLQEIAVAKNVVVACGNKKYPLEAFETICGDDDSYNYFVGHSFDEHSQLGRTYGARNAPHKIPSGSSSLENAQREEVVPDQSSPPIDLDSNLRTLYRGHYPHRHKIACNRSQRPYICPTRDGFKYRAARHHSRL